MFIITGGLTGMCCITAAAAFEASGLAWLGFVLVCVASLFELAMERRL